ncbi:MAG TPA: hypothetical protein VI685_09505, partial [Candidatus Angelobacter sp.]
PVNDREFYSLGNKAPDSVSNVSMQDTLSRCSECQVQLTRFSAKVRGYRAAVNRLDSCVAEGFNLAYEVAECAREALEHACTALENHIAEHGAFYESATRLSKTPGLNRSASLARLTVD